MGLLGLLSLLHSVFFGDQVGRGDPGLTGGVWPLAPLGRVEPQPGMQ